ncbi:hypothetical protein [Pyruvatibacter sp.]
MQTPVSPYFFASFATLGVIGVLGWIALSIVAAPADEPMFHFGESGAVTALSTVFMAMSSALALAVFYLRMDDWKSGAWFWLLLAAAFAFLAIDEQLMLHERGGNVLENSTLGPSETFRNWNDLIVISYGLVALAIAALAVREILKSGIFALLFATAFAFYAIHTGLDSLLPSDLAWKDAPEESAKLLCALFLFLALCARFLDLADRMKRPDTPHA